MADICRFTMKIEGNAYRFLPLLKGEGEVNIGRGAKITEETGNQDRKTVKGICKWSMVDSFIGAARREKAKGNKNFNIAEVCEHYGTKISATSKGDGFTETLICKDGRCIYDRKEAI